MAAASLQMHLQHSPRKKNFGYEETIRLLELWTHFTNGGTHPELGKGHRTGRLWLVISERMKAMGYNRGPEECKVRVGNLRAKYTKLKRSYLAGEGVPDWPYYPVLAKFLEGRGDYIDGSYDTGSQPFPEVEARPGVSHHHPGRRMGSSRSNDDSSVSMPDSASSAGSERNEVAPNGHIGTPAAEILPPPLPQMKRRAVSPLDDPLRRVKRPKPGTSSVLLSLMQAMLKIEEEHLKLQQERAASEAAMMHAVTAFFSNMSQMFGATKSEPNNNPGSGAGASAAHPSKTPSNPSSSCSNSPAYAHAYNNPMANNNTQHQISSQQQHYQYGGLSQPSPSPSSAPMSSPAAYPMSPAYQQGVNSIAASAAGWYNNGGSNGKGAVASAASIVAHAFSNDILGIPKNRHDAM